MTAAGARASRLAKANAPIFIIIQFFMLRVVCEVNFCVLFTVQYYTLFKVWTWRDVS